MIVIMIVTVMIMIISVALQILARLFSLRSPYV
jgi:hypothetical protein